MERVKSTRVIMSRCASCDRGLYQGEAVTLFDREKPFRLCKKCAENFIKNNGSEKSECCA